MSIYIKNMKMPTIEMEWTIRYGADGKWYAIDTNAETTDGEWHEIISVPQHGGLIDRKVAFDYWLCAANDFCWSPTDENFKKALEATPTIIPASEENE